MDSNLEVFREFVTWKKQHNEEGEGKWQWTILCRWNNFYFYFDGDGKQSSNMG
jgi:hypothetical protein